MRKQTPANTDSQVFVIDCTDPEALVLPDIGEHHQAHFRLLTFNTGKALVWLSAALQGTHLEYVIITCDTLGALPVSFLAVDPAAKLEDLCVDFVNWRNWPEKLGRLKLILASRWKPTETFEQSLIRSEGHWSREGLEPRELFEGEEGPSSEGEAGSSEHGWSGSGMAEEGEWWGMVGGTASSKDLSSSWFVLLGVLLIVQMISVLSEGIRELNLARIRHL